MNLDWIFAIVAFMVFVGWGFSYYSSFFEEKADVFAVEAEHINEKVTDFLSVDYHVLPVVFDSENDTSNKVLYFDYTWPEGTKNSTRVFSGEQSLSCMIVGDKIYWQSDVTEGKNFFRLEFFHANTTLNCDSEIPTENSSQAIPLVSEKKRMLSQEKIDTMLGMDYDEFRNSLDIHQRFRIELDTGVTETYGPVPPTASSVYVKESRSRIAESGDSVSIRVLVW